MKTFYLSLCFLFCILSSSAQNVSSITKNDNAWKDKAVEELQKQAYKFIPVVDGAFKSLNSSNNLQMLVSPNGYLLNHSQTRENKSDWKVNFSIIAIGNRVVKKDKSFSIEQVSPNSLVYHYPDFSIEYINSSEGLRQNFIINKRSVNEDFQKVTINLQTRLNASIAGGNRLLLKDGSGKLQLAYDGLKVWDANQKELPARLKLNSANELQIIVDTRNAVYPVTIDPLNHTPEWTTSAEGVLPALIPDIRVDAAYGYTVAGLGDVNGDGYDDVAISAPAAPDVISNPALAAVGAVYVYFGSATGLPITPSRTLRSSTPIANALFGYSVAGGDVTGDGKNDIIVGAPLDQYTTTAEGGLFSDPTVTVTAGKVYVFRGEDVTSVASPSPFLTINLSGTNFFSVGILGNVAVKSLFGFSVAATEDMNGDGKGEVIVGAPGYLGIDLLDAKTGAAYVYYSNDLSTTAPVSLDVPTPSLLGISLPLNNLLYGFSVDGVGDYNKDGHPDVVVGAPTAIINGGGLLSGSAYVYFGTGSGVNSNLGAQLIPSTTLLSNVANLFGFSVRGVRGANGLRNGNILSGAPGGSVLNNVLNLQLKTGNLYVFKAKTVTAGSTVTPDQNIPSPRNASLLTLLENLNLNVTALFGFSLDNVLDVNCDGYGDIIAGEPLSTSVGLIGADVVGGAAFIFLGKPDGTYVATPYWTLTTEVSMDLGINATGMIGYSVAGGRYVKGRSAGPRAIVGSPARALDFGTGLLNLGSTFSTLFGFTSGNNGLGKAYAFGFSSCNDNDKDGIPDAIDVDDDNDGIPDRFEFAQSDNGYAEPATDPSADDDGDGTPNYKDADYTNCNSLNANGICNRYDKDGDGIPNHFDLDSDNDGLQDVIEAGGHDDNGDGRVDCTSGCDADNDGLLSPVDLTSTTDAYATVHSKLSNGSVEGTTSGRMLDTDSDGVPDFLDIDSDNDGIYDLVETGGADANGDGRVDYTGTFATVDTDNDGWINYYDADTNNDGDVTDAGEGTMKALIISSDSNNDHLADSWTDGPAPDKFPVDLDSDNRPNYRDLDSDSDGINDVLEAGGVDPDGNGLIGTGSPVVNTDGYATATLSLPLISTDSDVNNDGRPDDDNDQYQTPYHNGGGGMPSTFNPDQDGDSRPNFLDLDSDNDGINDIIEGRIDRNADGIPDTQGQDADEDGLIDNKTDVDRDGIADVVDFIDNQYGDGKSPSGIFEPVNTDGPDPNPALADSDNVPDYLDLDSDNDGVFDTREGGNGAHDQDGNGIIDCDGNVYTSCDPDLDGILEKVDGKPAFVGDAPGNSLPNTDGTDNEDYRDTNSDNDDTSNDDNFDTVEKRGLDEDADNDGRVEGADTDGDGIINIPSIDNNNIFGGNDISLVPLPVHMISFSGKDSDKKVQLSWVIENEIAFNHYELERSSDGVRFSAIAVVLPFGKEGRNSYAYTDDLSGLNDNTYFYRLKMIDRDGSFAYSPILSFGLEAGAAKINVFPNPVRTEFTVSLQGMKAGIYKMEITAASGQVHLVKQLFIDGNYTEKIYRKNLPAGMYLLRIIDVKNNKAENFSVILQ
jgi:hypothetical protein